MAPVAALDRWGLLWQLFSFVCNVVWQYRFLWNQTWDTLTLNEFAGLSLLEDVDIVCILHQQMIDMDLPFLSESPRTSDCLGHT